MKEGACWLNVTSQQLLRPPRSWPTPLLPPHSRRPLPLPLPALVLLLLPTTRRFRRHNITQPHGTRSAHFVSARIAFPPRPAHSAAPAAARRRRETR